ncbi:immunoglobulin superfamily member turtle isoform X4 [Musca autumnalis]|uniref:immunoglobulin superfamily member turtle isoform X4 n=1 Tax=Musca autumnalis TaxID=221902 RepID=UPI003CF83C33
MGMCADPGSYRRCQALSRTRLTFATNIDNSNNNRNVNHNNRNNINKTLNNHNNNSNHNNFNNTQQLNGNKIRLTIDNKRRQTTRNQEQEQQLQHNDYQIRYKSSTQIAAAATVATLKATTSLQNHLADCSLTTTILETLKYYRLPVTLTTSPIRYQRRPPTTTTLSSAIQPAAAITIPKSQRQRRASAATVAAKPTATQIDEPSIANLTSTFDLTATTATTPLLAEFAATSSHGKSTNTRRQFSSITSTSAASLPSSSSSSSPLITTSATSTISLRSPQLKIDSLCHWLRSSFHLTIVFFIILLLTKSAYANNNIPEDAVHITAILGEGVIFNCHVEFPNDHPVPYVLQWDKKVSETGSDLPIYIWYESYPEHIEDGYKGRVSRVAPDSPFGSASLNLTNIKESDQGWYECKVVFLNRDPKQHKNGTWFHLDVHAPPRFSVTPDDIIYVNLGDSIILNCQADGTPTPEILWYKDANPVDPSPTVGIFNDGTELRISTIRHEDIGEYTCIARNGEGQVSHTARVIIAGGAVIMVPPTNQTRKEGEKVIFSCEAKAMPGNVTVRWFREGSPVREVASLETRITIRKDGSLIINPVGADDSGQYLCEVTNGIGDPQSASAYLNVLYSAKVTFTPTVQYLPYGLAGVVQCYIKSNPQLQYVTWTKDKRLLEPYQMKDIVVMANGSLLFTHVSEEHQGRYTCQPYNSEGSQGASGTMEVLVRKPPTFTVEPESLYQRKVGDSVEMHCDAVEAEGTQKPTIKWQRQGGEQLSDTQRNRIRISGGNITIENLRREDFGYYQCVVSNEVATLMSQTQLVIEGTQPHAPYNITGKATESSITLQWMPGYSGGSEYKQDYTIWYREAGAADWQTISVTPSGSTEVTINGLASGTTYEFQVVGRNVLGDGMMSKVMTVRTVEAPPARNVKAATQPPDHVFQLMPDEADLLAYFDIYFHTDSKGSIVYSPPKLKLKGPKPGPPRNLTVTEVSNGFLISWQAPLERAHIVKFYTIKYRTDAQWKTLNRGQIRPEETQYLVKNLVGGRTYYFRVLANSEKSYESSDEVKFPVPARVKHKAITAGVVGGILFFIVAIILSVCAVKICNKRKRRKQEKEFNMVACRITDARNIAAVNNHLQHHHQHQQQQQQQPLSQLSQHPQQQQQQQQHHHHLQQQMHNRNTGSISASQVPLKKYKQTRISSLTTILIAILHWIWPPDRCNNCHSIYSSPTLDESSDGRRKSLSEIQRSRDGRFVLTSSKSGNAANAITNGELSGGDGHENGSFDEVDNVDTRRNSSASQKSSSDDGGFLSRRNFITARASWRRPLVASPSQLSLQSVAAGSARGLLQGLGGLLKIGGGGSAANNGSGGGGDCRDSENLLSGARYQNVYGGNGIYRNLHNHHSAMAMGQQQAQPASRPLHINTISGGLQSHHMHQVFSPSKVSRIFSSSPASSPNGVITQSDEGLLTSPWAMTTPNQSSTHFTYNPFSDLSTVYPGSAERSVPTLTPTASGNLSRYRYYNHELPSLRTIQEETRRLNYEQQQQQQQQHQQQHLDFMPLQMDSPPSWRSYYQHSSAPYYHSYRPRTRWYPRHYSRLFGRSQGDLMSPLPHLNLTLRSNNHLHHHHPHALGLDASPESRSSSSGFGSKNTSNHPHGSHHSGSTSEWRLLPPYRPPPPPPSATSGGAATGNSAYFGMQQMATQQAPVQSQQAQGQVPMPQQQQQQAQQQQLTPQQATQQLHCNPYNTLPFSASAYQQHYSPSNYFSSSTQRTLTPPYTMEHWLDMITRLNAATDNVNLSKAVDVGSVDGHYEFDPSTPTPSASTPTGGLLREDLNLHIDTTGHFLHQTGGGQHHGHHHGSHTMGPLSSSSSLFGSSGMGRKSRLPGRYDNNIEARLQAMREEFYEYRKRQAMQRAGVAELESVC